MDPPRAPRLALSCDMREMAFRNKVSDCRLKKIFHISSSEDLEAVKVVLGLGFLNAEGWPRINSGIASIFVENLLVLRPSKVEVVNLAAYWLTPSFCGNLASEVANFSLVSWSVSRGALCSQGGNDVGMADLEKHFQILLDFTKSLVVFARDKKSGRARIKLPDVRALGMPLEPVPCWWVELRADAGGAFEHLWQGWLKGSAPDVDSELELGMDQGLWLG
ncbi:hypothetical protein KI387_017392, partial [Taxus chinensis]